MRMIFGVLGLLVALAIVGVLAKKQLSATKVAVPPGISVPGAGASDAGGQPQSAREQSQHFQQQVKQQMDAIMQQPRVPRDAE